MEEIIPDGKDIPTEAYRYWPTPSDISENSGKSLVRYIFYQTSLTDFECSQLLDFKSHLKKHHPEFLIPDFFCDEELLRILLGCKFDLKRSSAALFSSISWRSTNLVNSFRTLLPLCSSLLNSGCMYFHGRDHKYRPLLVINVERLDLKTHSVSSYCYLLCFLLEYAIQRLMIPGQIENWVVITDLGSKGLTQLPISEIKSIVKTLQDNFRCRMIVNYLVNAPTSLYFLWGVVKKFIEEHTIKKIRICKESAPGELKKHFAGGQYEEKYGGTAPNAKVFWPPCFPPGPFHVEGGVPEQFLTDVNTFHVYNRPPESEISSDMGDISENIKIVLPQSQNVYEIYMNSRKSRALSQKMSYERERGDGEDEIDEEYERSLREANTLTESEVSRVDIWGFEGFGRAEAGEEASGEGKGDKEEDGEVRAPRNSSTPIIVNTKTELKSNRLWKFCKCCTKKRCVIY